MLSFAALRLIGTVTGAAIAPQHRLSLRRGRTVQHTAVWLHRLAAWRLPALLGFRILKTYCF